MKNLIVSLVFSTLFVSTLGFAAPKAKVKKIEKPVTPMVFFEEPQDGAMVAKKFKIKMGLMGYAIKPAGDKTPNSGHHHVLVDSEPIAAGAVVPMDATHLHFGKGQTETEVELAPGTHTLTLQFADGNHISYGPDLSKSITITVK